MQKKILLIHTGGTISMKVDENSKEVKQSSTSHPLANLKNLSEQDCLIEETYLFNIPSPHMTIHRMLELGNFINSHAINYDGIVITHGTDTLEETAYFLELYLHVDIPVVVTGAMRSSNELGADGIYNVTTALYLVENGTNDHGVLVVMNGEIHLAKDVYKSSSIQLDSFKSQYGPLGIVTPHEIQWFRKSHRNIIKSKQLKILEKSVSLLKLHTSIDDLFLEQFLGMPMDGLVIEAYGQGNVSERMAELIELKIDMGIPVVITSRTLDGFIKPTYGYAGGGADLLKRGIIPAPRLTSQKACIQLILGLENNFNLRKYFNKKTYEG